MTLAEFKAWFEGFTEDMDGAPSAKQFEKIKAKVADINGVAVTERVFVDRYVPRYRDVWSWPYISVGTGNPEPIRSYSTASAGQAVGAINYAPDYASEPPAFDAHVAMRDLGRVEAHAA